MGCSGGTGCRLGLDALLVALRKAYGRRSGESGRAEEHIVVEAHVVAHETLWVAGFRSVQALVERNRQDVCCKVRWCGHLLGNTGGVPLDPVVLKPVESAPAGQALTAKRELEGGCDFRRPSESFSPQKRWPRRAVFQHMFFRRRRLFRVELNAQTGFVSECRYLLKQNRHQGLSRAGTNAGAAVMVRIRVMVVSE